MVAITPSGVVCFISKLYGGSITDRELFIETGIIDKMDVGDSVMADKGFTVPIYRKRKNFRHYKFLFFLCKTLKILNFVGKNFVLSMAS